MEFIPRALSPTTGVGVDPDTRYLEKDLAELRGSRKRPHEFLEDVSPNEQTRQQLGLRGCLYSLPKEDIKAVFDDNFRPPTKDSFLTFDEALESCKQHAFQHGYGLVE
jgi:hypothetical protein